MRLVVIACAAAVLTGAVVAATLGGDESPARNDLEAGVIYSTDAGDPLDVEFSRYTEYGCLHISGDFIPSGTSCFDIAAPAQGSYVVAIPLNRRVAPAVVGVLPNGADEAIVRVGQVEVRAVTRGRWFIASLEPGSLGRNNANPVSVEYS
jgi:hypothetical protein